MIKIKGRFREFIKTVMIVMLVVSMSSYILMDFLAVLSDEEIAPKDFMKSWVTGIAVKEVAIVEETKEVIVTQQTNTSFQDSNNSDSNIDTENVQTEQVEVIEEENIEQNQIEENPKEELQDELLESGDGVVLGASTDKSSDVVTEETIEEPTISINEGIDNSISIEDLNNETDKEILAKVIHFISPKENTSLEKKTGIGLVLINRVLSSDYPNSLQEVVQLDVGEEQYLKIINETTPIDSDYRAVDSIFEQLDITSEDGLVVNAALYFVDPKNITPNAKEWLENNFVYTGKIENLHFYK